MKLNLVTKNKYVKKSKKWNQHKTKTAPLADSRNVHHFTNTCCWVCSAAML